jgi:hypothetical protein
MKKIIIIFYVMIPFISWASYQQNSLELSSVFSKLEGVIVAVDKNQIIVDIGKNKNAQIGMILDVYELGKEIIHPITGQKLGRKTKLLGKVKITQVQNDFSIVTFLDKPFSIKLGNLVKATNPVKISFNFNNMDKRQELLLKDAFSRYFFITDKPDYILNVSQDDEGGINLKMFNAYTNQEVLYRYFSNVKISCSGSSNVAKDIVMSPVFGDEYRTITVGDFFGDGNDYIAAATKKKVDIFLFTGKKFEKVQEIKNDFDEILSVDSADLNKNGRDELYITGFQNMQYADSYIYEVENKKFKILKANEHYLFRGITIEGVKKIICQKITRRGEFLGNIYFYEYAGDFMKTVPIENTEGYSIFGFGYGDVDGDGVYEVMRINEDNFLEIYKKGKIFYTSMEKFNKTSNYFTSKFNYEILREAINREQLDVMGKTEDELKNYMSGRIEFVGNTIILMQNILSMPMLESADSYKEAYIVGLNTENFGVSKRIKVNPMISDFYVSEGNGKLYLFAVRDMKSTLFFGGDSQFFYIEIEN